MHYFSRQTRTILKEGDATAHPNPLNDFLGFHLRNLILHLKTKKYVLKLIERQIRSILIIIVCMFLIIMHMQESSFTY